MVIKSYHIFLAVKMLGCFLLKWAGLGELLGWKSLTRSGNTGWTCCHSLECKCNQVSEKIALLLSPQLSPNFYFYFTTFRSIRSYFFTSLHFIKHIVTPYKTSRAPRRRSGVWFMNNWLFSINLLNRFTNSNKRFINELKWSDCSCSIARNSCCEK